MSISSTQLSDENYVFQETSNFTNTGDRLPYLLFNILMAMTYQD